MEELTKEKNGVWIIENPNEKRIMAVRSQLEKTKYNPRFADNRVIIENIPDEDFVTVCEYFNKVNEGIKPSGGEDDKN